MFDGSDHATRALDVAAEFLDPQRCTVTVLAAAKLTAPTLTPPHTGYATSAPTPEVEREVLAPARGHAERAAQVLGERVFAVDVTVILGHPVKRLWPRWTTPAAGADHQQVVGRRVALQRNHVGRGRPGRSSQRITVGLAVRS